jgi:hypothetical protein
VPDNASCITIMFTSLATEGRPVINDEMGSGGVEWVTKSVQIAQPGQPPAAGAGSHGGAGGETGRRGGR